MSLGKVWIIVEGETDETRKLLSIIDSRRGYSFVRDYFRQSVVDRHASFLEKIAFKKNWKTSPFSVLTERNFQGFLWSTVDPVMQCHCCQRLSLEGRWLSYTFLMIDEAFENDDVTFKSVTHRVAVDA